MRGTGPVRNRRRGRSPRGPGPWSAFARGAAPGPLGWGGSLAGRILALVPLSIRAHPEGFLLALGGGLALLLLALSWRRRGVDRATGRPRREVQGVLRRARRFARAGRALQAAHLLRGVGRLSEAAPLFERAGAYLWAAEAFLAVEATEEAARNFEAGGSVQRAADLWASLGKYREAGERYARAGWVWKAAEMCEKGGDFARAADLYRKGGALRRAGEMAALAKRWDLGGEIFEALAGEVRAALPEGLAPEGSRPLAAAARESGRLYLQAGRKADAARMLQEGGLFAEAARARLDLGEADRAGELYLKAGLLAEGAEALDRAGKGDRAAALRAEVHLKRGEILEASLLFEKAGELRRAAELQGTLGNPLKAAELFEQGGDPLRAAEAFRSAGEIARAAANFEAAGSFLEAADLFARAGSPERAAELLERGGKAYEAGRRFLDLGLSDRAIAALQRVEPGDEHLRDAAHLLGDLFKEKGMLAVAAQKYQEAIGGEELHRGSLGAYYNLAVVREKSDDLRGALEIYEKILALDFHYADVASRINVIRKLVSGKTPGEAEADAFAKTVVGGEFRGGARRAKKYEVDREIGRGGMGVVYRARDTILNRTVALKVLPPGMRDNPKAIESFFREAQAAAALNHPNIVTIYEAGEEEGLYYIAMEMIEGSTVKQILKEHERIPVAGVLLILGQMCKALAYAHERKIVHRDVKPSNVMWTPKKVVKIMDFGLAKAMEEMKRGETVVGGTPYYMSPEQTLGERVDHRTDIYSLGVSAFEMATGRLPFPSGDVGYHHVHTPPPDPRGIASGIPEGLARAILRSMEKDPARRFQSCVDMFTEIRRAP